MSTITRDSAQNQLLKGFEAVADPVGLSLGAEGAYAIIENPVTGVFHPTKDGVTIAKSVFCENKVQQLGANLAKQTSHLQAKESGDNTTTVLVLALQLLKNGLKHIQSRDISPVEFRKGMNIAAEEAKKIIAKLSKKATAKDILSIARVSANGDDEIAGIISGIYEKVGSKAIINIEKTGNYRTTVKYSEGMILERGYKSPGFADAEKTVCEMEDAYVLIFEGQLENLTQIEQPIMKAGQEEKPILIMADAIHEDALDMLLDNKRRGSLKCCYIQNPDYGDKKKFLCDDLAIYTNAEVYVKGISTEFKMGMASKIIVSHDETSIVQLEKPKSVDVRIEALRKQADEETDENKKLFWFERIENLSNQAATIFVGSESPSKTDEISDRMDDAKCAVASASKGGYCAGGGVTYIEAAKKMKMVLPNSSMQAGYDVFVAALYAPFNQLLSNADVEPGQFTDEVGAGIGYDIRQRKMVNLFTNKIIDSTSSLISAITHATSTCDLIFNTKIVTVIGTIDEASI